MILVIKKSPAAAIHNLVTDDIIGCVKLLRRSDTLIIACSPSVMIKSAAKGYKLLSYISYIK
jgi:hypothetical protein